MAVPTAPIVAGSMVGAYVVANATEHRQLGGVVMAVGGGVSLPQWVRNAGPIGAAALTAVYVGSMGVSHPVAKKIGAWPAVFAAAGVSALAAWAISDRRR